MGRRIALTASLLAASMLTTSALAACGGPTEDDLERRAREALGRDGWSQLEIAHAEGEDEGTFDFTGVREGQACEGTIQVHVAGDRTTSSMQSRCD